MSASSATLVPGHSVTFTATVTTPGGDPTPTSADGTVTFYDGATVLGSATLSDQATATLTTTALAAGSHLITAAYSGDNNFAASHFVQSVVPAVGLNQNWDVAVDGSGDVFIADPENSRVVEVKPDGTQTTVGSGLSFPWGVAVDGQGDVFIADQVTNQVVEAKPDGSQTTIGSGLNQPYGLALDSAGDLFIADTDNNRVVEVKADGTQTTVLSGLNQPTGLALDSAGDLFIADFGNNQVVEVMAHGGQTTVGSGLSQPAGLAVDSAGDLFIAETGNNQVVEVMADGAQTTLGSGLNVPTGLAVDGMGDLFIADTLNQRVVEVKVGAPVTVWLGHTYAGGQREPREHHVRRRPGQQPAQRHCRRDCGRQYGQRAGGLSRTPAPQKPSRAGNGLSEFVTFTPGDTVDYATVSTTVSVNVSAATPTVNVSPVSITYGTALSNSQLSGTATWTVGGNPVSVPGTFTYTSAAGTVLNAAGGQSEAVTFTPGDSADYNSVSTTVSVIVAAATPTVSVSPVSITYGTALSNSQLSGTATWTIGGNPVSVPGTLTYTSPAGTVPAPATVRANPSPSRPETAPITPPSPPR